MVTFTRPLRVTVRLLVTASVLAGVHLAALEAQDKQGKRQEEPPGRALEATLSKIEPVVQRRIIEFVNRAHAPRDFTALPQDVRVKFEHGPPDPQQPQPEGPPQRIEFDPTLAKRLLSERPVLGYRDLREILVIDWPRWRDLLDHLLPFFGPRFWGKWVEFGPLESDGVEQSIMHAAMLHTGRVLLIPSSTDTVLWDPDHPTDPATVLPGSSTGLTADLFCSGHSFLTDGRLLVVGGGGGAPGAASSQEGWKFDPTALTWTQTESPMAYRRWYPTTVTLGYEPGEVLVASGWMTGTNAAPHMEIYSEASDSFHTVTATGPVGEKLFSPTYPGLHLLPGGEIFHAPVGFGNCSQLADPWSPTDDSGYFVFSTSTTTGSWTDIGPNVRTKGMSVLLLDTVYPYVRGLVVGGGSSGTSGTAQTINLSTFAPSWDFAFPLLEPRVHPNVVLLPDGSVFVCGGMNSTGAPPPSGGRCELYEPRTGALREMAALHRPRHYHSVAVLLPSGQVMAAGGARESGCSLSVQNTIEVFSPPYLFRGPRPKILDAPSLVHHGDDFTIKAPAPCKIDRVVFARPMAVTHQTDSEQRVIPLAHETIGGNRIRVRAPGASSPHSIAPRGYYMLFVVNTNGVPSVASWIYLH